MWQTSANENNAVHTIYTVINKYKYLYGSFINTYTFIQGDVFYICILLISPVKWVRELLLFMPKQNTIYSIYINIVKWHDSKTSDLSKRRNRTRTCTLEQFAVNLLLNVKF